MGKTSVKNPTASDFNEWQYKKETRDVECEGARRGEKGGKKRKKKF